MRIAPLLGRMACVVLIAALVGCGSDSKKDSSAASSTPASSAGSGGSTGPAQSDAANDLASYKGIYVATLTKAQLAKAADPEFKPGPWTMSIAETDPTDIRLEPGGFDLKATSLANDELVTEPDTTCPVPQGRAQKNTFTVRKTATGLHFDIVTAGCKADAAVLAAPAEWRKT